MIRNNPDRGEVRENLLGEFDGSSPPLQNSSPDDVEARNDFGSISGNYIHRHHVEPRVKLHVPRQESFPFPLRYIDVTRGTSIGNRDLSDSWTRFTRFTVLEEKPQRVHMI